MGGQLTTKGREMVRDLLVAKKPVFSEVLNSEIAAKDFCRVALTMIQETPKLMECTEASLYTSLLKAAQLQLNCDGLLGEAYLVPFKDKRQGLIAQLLIGYKGLINLAMNTGHYKDVRARVVWSKDPFEISLGTDEYIKHEPSEFEEGEMRGCYAVAVGKDGTPTFEFMFAKKIWTHAKQYSKTWDKKNKVFYSDSIWKTNPEMAFKKTLIRKLCNRLPLSPKVKALLAREDLMERDLELPEEDVYSVVDIDSETGEVIEDEKEKPKKPNLSSAIKSTKQEPPPSEEEMEETIKFHDLCIAIDDRLKELFPKDNQAQEKFFQNLATKIKGPSEEDPYLYDDFSINELLSIWDKIKKS